MKMELDCFFKLILWLTTIGVVKVGEKQVSSFDEAYGIKEEGFNFDMLKEYGRSYVCFLNGVKSQRLMEDYL